MKELVNKMEKRDLLKVLRSVNNAELCELLGDNENEACSGCPLQTESPFECLLDDMIYKIENSK